jgi:threonine/homoserine/homoserine lactone efflux protein
MDSQDFLVFAIASLMLNITPGSDMLYVATRSTSQGIKSGIISSFGIMAGCVVHATAAVIGLSAIIANSATGFMVIKFAGALYLVYLGVRSFLGENAFAIDSNQSPMSSREIFFQGALTNILNPMVALFFLAFLPQFVDARSTSAPSQILLLGIWFTISGTIVNTIVAIVFGRMGNWLAHKTWFIKWQSKVTGILLVALGIRIAMTRR